MTVRCSWCPTLPALAAAMLLSLAAPVLGPQPAQAAKQAALSEQDMADVARAEAYLNSISTLRARFIQVSAGGQAAEGKAYLSRPGRMRLDYDPPVRMLVVADGRFLIHYDEELRQPTYVPLSRTPAGLLLRANVDLNGRDARVTDVRRGRGLVEIDMVQSSDPGAGKLTLRFDDNPFELRQWTVRDAQGQVTTVSLSGAQTGVSLNPELFTFKDPKVQNPYSNPN